MFLLSNEKTVNDDKITFLIQDCKKYNIIEFF